MNFDELDKLHAAATESVLAVQGRTFERVRRVRFSGGEALVFVDRSKSMVIYAHSQDCCESVEIDQVDGNLSDLEGAEILSATRSTSEANTENGMHQTWSFYKFRSHRGDVTVRWLGESNGYYSEEVDEILSPCTDPEHPYCQCDTLLVSQIDEALWR